MTGGGKLETLTDNRLSINHNICQTVFTIDERTYIECTEGNEIRL